MYRFVVNALGDGSGTCSLFNEASVVTTSVGFKIGNGDDYTVWGTSQAVGAALDSQPSGVSNEAGCKDACTAASDCEVYA
jgi:hypothetical protein